MKITKICWDMDGVLVNLAAHVESMGYDMDLVMSNSKIRSGLWKTVAKNHRKGIPFWANMQPMHYMFDMWQAAQDIGNRYGIEEQYILSATGHAGGASVEKPEWVKRYMPNGDNIRVVLVATSSDKALYASPDTVLIDDREKSTIPFQQAGGHVILHRSPAETIQTLETMLCEFS